MIEDPTDKFKIDINDYYIINTISSKKHSIVYLIENKSTGRKYAAKTNLNKFKVLTDKEKEFIWGELGFLIRVQHPIFLKFHGFSFTDFDNNKNMTMLMEYMENGSLSQIIDDEQQGKHHKDFDNTKKQLILVGISCAMMILHRHHILHRDLKPENVLLDQNYEPRISDVALTKFFDPSNTLRSDYPSFTYMAPEVIKYNDFSPKSDVYSFGILMFEVIMGYRCYSKIIERKSYTHCQLKAKILKGLRPEFRTPIKKGVQRLIERCWSKDPIDRPTFSELYNKLSLLAEEFDGKFDEKFDEADNDVHKYCLDDVDASKIISYISEISDETDEATKLRCEIHRLKNEVNTLNETIEDQSEDIKSKTKEIQKLKKMVKNQSDQFDEKIEIEHSEMKAMRVFILQHVRNQFLESKEHSSPVKLLATLDEMFIDPNVIALFSDFCQNKMCPEYMCYVEDMAAYYNMKEDLKPLLFFDFRDKYFKEGSPYFLNIKKNVINDICDAKEPSPELLDNALQLVYAVYRVELIREFKNSPKYIEYISNPKNRRKRLSKLNK